MFKNKILQVAGVTASFVHAVIAEFLDTNVKEIRIFLWMRLNKIICIRNIITLKLILYWKMYSTISQY